MSDFIKDLERKELFEMLYKAGYGELVDTWLSNEDECHTKKGRLNQCGACRVLNLKPKELKDSLIAMRRILEPEAFKDEEEATKTISTLGRTLD